MGAARAENAVLGNALKHAASAAALLTLVRCGGLRYYLTVLGPRQYARARAARRSRTINACCVCGLCLLEALSLAEALGSWSVIQA